MSSNRLSEFDLWRLHDAFNLAQAAALISGNYPSEIADSQNGPYLVEYEDEGSYHAIQKNALFQAALSALMMAVRIKRLQAQIAYLGKYQHVRYVGAESEGYWEPIGEIDPLGTIVEVDHLRAWLESRGVKTGFFFAIGNDAPDYLDPNNSRYAPKLAAAVQAWLSVTEPNGRHPKQALAKWLREHAAEFGLTDDEGKPNETGIEEAAKVANWQPGGGAPKTPNE
jgi:hypothetical protein